MERRTEASTSVEDDSAGSRWPKWIATFGALVVALVLTGAWIGASTGASTGDDQTADQGTQSTECWDEYRRARSNYRKAWKNRRAQLVRSVVSAPEVAPEDCTAATDCLFGYHVRGKHKPQLRVLLPRGANSLTSCDLGATRTLIDPSDTSPVTGQCWDEYSVRANRDPIHISIIAPAGVTPSNCVPADDCMIGLRRNLAKQNRIFVPLGADPATGCQTALDGEPVETTLPNAPPAKPTSPTVTEAPATTAPPETTEAPATTAPPATTASPLNGSTVYFNDFSGANDRNRVDHFVQYRDPWVVNHQTGSSDHAADGPINCSAPEQTREQTRDNPHGHIYQCFPGGNSGAGHMMAYAMDTSGYGFVGSLPDQVFEDVNEISVDINTTSAGHRNFVEIKVIPANQTFVNAMPCGPDLPCNDGWDYDDVNGVGASTFSASGTGLMINTPSRPDGYIFDYYNKNRDSNGDTNYRSCELNNSYCFEAAVHENNTGIRARFNHVFKDNGDGTLSFGIDDGNNMHWVTAPGAFPDGPVRVVVAFHNYTGTKDGDGPGYDNNVSPTTGGFTWHWDNLAVTAGSATPSATFFGGHTADRIVTPDGCIAFSQGQRTLTNNTDIAPRLICDASG